MTTTESRSVIGAAQQHLKAKNHEEAVRLVVAHLRDDPLDVEALNVLGLAYFQLKKYGEAKTTYFRMWSAEPTDFRAMYGIGMTLQRLGQLDEAAHWFLATLTINPDFERAAKRLTELADMRARSQEMSPGSATSPAQAKKPLTTLSLPQDEEDLEAYRISSRDRARIDMMNQYWYGIPWPLRLLQVILIVAWLGGVIYLLSV